MKENFFKEKNQVGIEFYEILDMVLYTQSENPQKVNSSDPDQTPQNATSGQGLQCLQIV